MFSTVIIKAVVDSMHFHVTSQIELTIELPRYFGLPIPAVLRILTCLHNSQMVTYTTKAQSHEKRIFPLTISE